MKSRKKLIIAIAVVAVMVAAYFLFFKKKGTQITYEPAEVTRESLSVVILATGTVQPENRLDIKAPIAGRAEEVKVVEGQTIKKGQILAWMSSSERAAMIDAARAEGAATLKKWEDLYRPTPVIAPIDGTIIQRNVEPGQTFTNTDSIFVMSDRLIVEAQVDETDISQIKLGGRAEIILDAYAKEKIPASVRQIAFEAKTINNVTSYIVKVLPDEVPEFMRAGMTANVNFSIESKNDVLTIPNDAIKTERGKMKLIVPGPDGKPAPESPAVEFGMTDGRRTEIVSGLKEGDTVLIENIIAEEKSDKSSSPFGGPKLKKRDRKSAGGKKN
jgi:macrolide-specific efflux system membrane fusion protein